jgi:hypothetical protein
VDVNFQTKDKSYHVHTTLAGSQFQTYRLTITPLRGTKLDVLFQSRNHKFISNDYPTQKLTGAIFPVNYSLQFISAKYFFGSCCYLSADFCASVQLRIGTSADYFAVCSGMLGGSPAANLTTRTRLAWGLTRRELDDSLLHADYFHRVEYFRLNAACLCYIGCVRFADSI